MSLQELESLGVVLLTFPTSINTNDTIYLNSLVNTIRVKTNTFTSGGYESRIEKAIQHFGMDKNYSLMMLYEWYRQKENIKNSTVNIDLQFFFLYNFYKIVKFITF